MANDTAPPGPGVDAEGNPVYDPTRNVLNLVEAAIKRQDDLRVADQKLREIEQAHLRDFAQLRATHARELREAESARIDAIRAVDVGAVKSAAEVSATQATTLAAQVANSAEALRNQVTLTATAQESKLAAALEPIQKDIADLRRVQYEGVGSKTQVVESQARGGSVGLWVGVGFAALTVISATVIGAATLIVLLLR